MQRHGGPLPAPSPDDSFECALCGHPRPGFLVVYCPDCGELTPPRRVPMQEQLPLEIEDAEAA